MALFDNHDNRRTHRLVCRRHRLIPLLISWWRLIWRIPSRGLITWRRDGLISRRDRLVPRRDGLITRWDGLVSRWDGLVPGRSWVALR